MGTENKEPISRDEYNALFEKLANVEGLLKEQVPTVPQADFDKMADAVTELKGQIDEMAPEFKKMAEADKPDLVEKSTVDELTKKLETVQKQVETIESMPMLKGIQDIGTIEPGKYDVMKGVFHTSFPEAGGR